MEGMHVTFDKRSDGRYLRLRTVTCAAYGTFAAYGYVRILLLHTVGHTPSPYCYVPPPAAMYCRSYTQLPPPPQPEQVRRIARHVGSVTQPLYHRHATVTPPLHHHHSRSKYGALPDTWDPIATARPPKKSNVGQVTKLHDDGSCDATLICHDVITPGGKCGGKCGGGTTVSGLLAYRYTALRVTPV